MAEQHDPSAETQNTGARQEHMIPKSRFDEVNEGYKNVKAQLEALLAKQDDAEKTRLAEQEEYRQLAEKLKVENDTLKPFKAQVEAANAALAETVDGMIAQLPEDARDLVPSFPDPRDTLSWLNKNAARLMKPSAPPLDGGARGDSGSTIQMELTPEDRKMAALMGVSLQEYSEFKKRHVEQQRTWLSEIPGAIKSKE